MRLTVCRTKVRAIVAALLLCALASHLHCSSCSPLPKSKPRSAVAPPYRNDLVEESSIDNDDNFPLEYASDAYYYDDTANNEIGDKDSFSVNGTARLIENNIDYLDDVDDWLAQMREVHASNGERLAETEQYNGEEESAVRGQEYANIDEYSSSSASKDMLMIRYQPDFEDDLPVPSENDVVKKPPRPKNPLSEHVHAANDTLTSDGDDTTESERSFLLTAVIVLLAFLAVIVGVVLLVRHVYGTKKVNVTREYSDYGKVDGSGRPSA